MQRRKKFNGAKYGWLPGKETFFVTFSSHNQRCILERAKTASCEVHSMITQSIDQRNTFSNKQFVPVKVKFFF